MKSMILVIGCLIGMASAFAVTPPEELEGRYTSSAYDGKYSDAWVEIRKAEQGGLELFFNVPCGGKLIPRVFKIIQGSGISGELELVEEGHGQCYTGNSPSVDLRRNTLTISTNPRILTPGFWGFYELTKSGPEKLPR